MSKTVAFLGLGVMGYPMAGHLANSDYKVRVYNRTFSKAEQWLQDFPGTAYRTPAEAASEAQIVMACVGNDDDLRNIASGENGAFSTMRTGSVFVDHTTASADIARELYKTAAERQIGFLDAPVSGGQAGAETGQLTVMVGVGMKKSSGRLNR